MAALARQMSVSLSDMHSAATSVIEKGLLMLAEQCAAPELAVSPLTAAAAASTALVTAAVTSTAAAAATVVNTVVPVVAALAISDCQKPVIDIEPIMPSASPQPSALTSLLRQVTHCPVTCQPRYR
jgi:hypothetical protein